ncbi:helix-turn-helix domain-containing protein [Paraburkholderia saeva]|uniref:helix-turn-helix domain-containing protein n=1 Tax=Paraburkholderia saeva TaxID=2777537 RepID=UPI001D8AFC8A|nr:helix-turn-helix domain-containing protein [Paraburkholderia saeva]CAG4900288.1 hypothetical protein R52603_02721 [Paraburkholderia saeva]
MTRYNERYVESVRLMMPALEGALPVALELAHLADEHGRSWPSIRYLCAVTGLKRTSVTGQLSLLRKRGWLRATGEYDGKTHRIPVVQLTFPDLAALRKERGKLSASSRQNRRPKGSFPPPNSPENRTIKPPANDPDSRTITQGEWSGIPGSNGPQNRMQIVRNSGPGVYTKESYTKERKVSGIATAIATRACEAPPSASAHALPDENSEREPAKRQANVHRSKKAAATSQGVVLVPAEIDRRTSEIATYLRAKGITRTAAVPVTFRQWAADPRVTDALLSEALKLYYTRGGGRYPVREFASVVDELLGNARPVKRPKGAA